MKFFNKEIKVALAAICALVLLFYGINFLKGINLFQSSTLYYVCFNDVTGLQKSNAVYAGGYPVGIVRQINYDYDHPGHIYVGIEVDKNMRIPHGSHAELVSSMLGTTTMNLLLGGTEEALHPGDTLTGGPHMGALEQASQMIPSIEALLPKLDSILSSLNALAADPALSQTLHNTAQITQNLTQTTEHLNGLLSNEVPQLTKQLNQTLQHAEGLTGKLEAVDYAGTVDKVNQTMDEARSLTQELHAKINSKEGSVGLLLNDRSLYDNLNQTLLASDSLLTNLRQHPKRYVHFSVFGKKDK